MGSRTYPSPSHPRQQPPENLSYQVARQAISHKRSQVTFPGCSSAANSGRVAITLLLLAQPGLSIQPEGIHNSNRPSSLFGQCILHTRGNLGIYLPGQQASSAHGAQAVGQDPHAHASGYLQFTEAARPGGKIT